MELGAEVLVTTAKLKHRHSIAALALLSIVAYGGGLLAPALFSDDWHFFIKGAAERAELCPDWSSFRPLNSCLLLVEHQLLGLNVTALHGASLVLNLMISMVLYFILDGLLPRWRGFSLVVSMLFLVYPSVYMKNWVIGANVQVPLLLFACGSLLLVRFWRGGRWWAWAGAILCVILSLGLYEMQLGLVLGVSLALACWPTRQPLPRRLALLAPALCAALFAVWRAWGQTALGIDQGSYGTEVVSLSPTVLMERLIAGYRMNLQWAWTTPLLYWFPRLQLQGAHANLWATLAAGGAMASVALLAAAAVRVLVRRPVASREGPRIEQRAELLQLCGLFAGGLAALGAGYIPIISVWGPTIWDYFGTRVNILPSIGAAVATAAAMGLVSLGLGRTRDRARLIFLTLMVALIVFGTATQINVQRETVVAWEQQKDVWQQMFRLAPNLGDGTGVYLTFPNAGIPFRPRPFGDGSWGVGATAALSLFYDNSSLHGACVDQLSATLRFTDEGIERPWGVVPYDEAIFFEYDAASSQLTLLDEVPGRLLGSARPVSDLGLYRILPGPAPQSDFRRLVE